MKTIYYKVIWVVISLIAILSSHKTFANAAQPGIWNAGGTVFTMLYPEDSLTFKKVQMQEERIYIQLYKGYAVVKGMYLFRNTTHENLQFKMGYPVNGIYHGGDVDLNEVKLDSLSQFKIKAKDNWLPLLKEPNREYSKINAFSDNWMVWNMVFAPEETQAVEVYFIVNTNNGQVRSGYENERINAFIYLLESGSVWHQPIEKGAFYVQLMNNLNIKNIKGFSQGFDFKFNKTHQLFLGTKNNFSPTNKDNLVITYGEYFEAFDFKSIISDAENLFSKIDELDTLISANLTYEKIEIGDPYQVESSFWGSFPNLLMLFVIYAPIIIGVLVASIIIWAVFKWIRIKKRKNKGV